MKYDASILTVLDFLSRNLIASDTADTTFLLYSVVLQLLIDFFEEGGRQYRGTTITKLYNETIGILEIESPATRRLIDVFGVQSFAFLNSSLRTFFTQDLEKEEDAALMFTAIISSRDPARFLAGLVAASLIHLHGRLQETPECDPDLFAARYLSLLPNLDVRLWLCNTETLLRNGG